MNNRKITHLPRCAIIKGASGCGKKSLISSILDDFTLIDMSDLRYAHENLNELIKKENIKKLVINEPFYELEIINNLENFYILTSKNDYFYKDFISIRLNYLDYEEFISFSKKNLSESLHLSNYLLLGQNPANVDLEPNQAYKNLQKLLKQNLNHSQILALKEIALKIGVQTSVLNLYENYKNYKKISKNDFFKLIKSLENEFLIHWVKHISKNVKKPYFTDFALRNALTYKKDFSKNYENLVANELLLIYDEIFYHDEISFLIPSAKLAILCEPFTNKDFIRLKSKKINKFASPFGIETILVLSLNEQFKHIQDDISYIAMPLNMWLLSKDLNDWD